MTIHRALIAGVGGLALYGALKPNEEKVIIINQGGETKPGESSTTAAAAAVTPVAPSAESTATPLAVAPVTTVNGVPLAPIVAVTPVDGTMVPVVPVVVETSSGAPSGASADPTTVVGSTQPISSDGSTPLAPYPTVTMAPADIPPYSGASIHYDQAILAPMPSSETPLASFPSNTPLVPLAPFPSSQPPPICAPGQNPDDPLMKCTPLTVAPMYTTPTTVDGAATAQKEVSSIPVASNTNENLQAQLKSSAVSCTVLAFNIFMIPILTLLMV